VFGRDAAEGLFYSALGRRLASAILYDSSGSDPNMGANDFVPTVAIDRASAAGAPIVKGEYLTFRLGGEEYGIDILKVQEIRGYDTVTRIANAPAHILGVINLRGVIVPIVDLRVKFALGEARYDAFTVVIVLNVAERVVGAVVDSVSDVLELAPEQIRAAPAFDALLDAGYITGLASVKQGDAERMLILLDIERLMRSSDMGLPEVRRH
jgi:purine-binding chemotaxis protein CheW